MTGDTTTVAHDIDAIARITAVPNILEAVTSMTGMRFAAVAKVSETQWITCAVRDGISFGLVPGAELPLETTICNEIRQHHQPVVFGHASTHPHYGQHHTPRLYGLESYISVPIFRTDGTFFGTLCAIDSAPADLDNPNIVATLQLFAELIGRQLEIEDKLSRSQAALKEAAEIATLREHFVTVLGQDMRDPLQAIITGLYLLKQSPSLGHDDEALVMQLQDCGNRMDRLIHDIMDFAAGRLADGMPMGTIPATDLGDDLRQVVAYLSAEQSSRTVKATIAVDGAVTCNRLRIKQMLSNVLTNAVAYGHPDQPVEVHAVTADGSLRLRVRNGGNPIPAALLPTIFEPRKRVTADGRSAGLGLGLFIASEIAKAHGGVLTLSSSSEDGTEVTFRMPLSEAHLLAPPGALPAAGNSRLSA
ncbi:MAG TPA: GAF domain-containing sensor histidine kinase [Lysobacter sp.]